MLPEERAPQHAAVLPLDLNAAEYQQLPWLAKTF
jgi:hypothetical protein